MTDISGMTFPLTVCAVLAGDVLVTSLLGGSRSG